MLLHDVHQHIVDVAPQVQVHVLLVLQRLPHLEKVDFDENSFFYILQKEESHSGKQGRYTRTILNVVIIGPFFFLRRSGHAC